MKILSWRGPRGWSRWHLVSVAPGDQTLCHLPVPDFAEMMLSGPTEPDDERVCLVCRERYGVSAAVNATLAILETPPYRRPLDRWHRLFSTWGVAAAPALAVILFDLVFTHDGIEWWRDLVGPAAVGGGTSGVVLGLQFLMRRLLG